MAVRISKRHNRDGSVTTRRTYTRKTLFGTTKSESFVTRSKPKKRGCYIATSVYGSYDCPQVWTLRRFRDEALANTLLGRLFIRIYYAVSPTLVRLLGGTRFFKIFLRRRLDSFVNRLQNKGVSDSPYRDNPDT